MVRSVLVSAGHTPRNTPSGGDDDRRALQTNHCYYSLGRRYRGMARTDRLDGKRFRRAHDRWLAFGICRRASASRLSPIIVFPSVRASKPARLVHAGTGAPVWMVPGRRVYRGRSASAYSLRRWLATPLSAFRQVFKREGCRVLMIQEYEYTRFDALVRLAAWLGIRAYASFQGGDRTLSRLEGLVRARSLEMCSGLLIASSEERLRVVKA